MRALVTGGAGFIGSHLTKALIGEDHGVRVLDNLSTGYSANLDGRASEVEMIEADLRDAAAVEKAARGCDVVFHLAALGSVPRSLADPRTTHDVNVTGTLNVLESVKKNGVGTVVMASSSSIYGDSSAESKSEDQPLCPISPYGASKAAAETYALASARAYGFSAVALRYFNVFGPYQDPAGAYAAVIPVFITRALRRQPWIINGDGKHSRDFTYVANVVAANLLALEAAPTLDPVAMNIACGGTVSLLELSDTIQLYAGADGVEPVFGPARDGDIVRSQADIGLAQETLGYQVEFDWRQGLEETVNWYAANLDRHSQ